MTDYGSLLPVLLLPIFLLVAGGLVIWWSLRLNHGEKQMQPTEMQAQQQFRQWRNRAAEEVMVQRLMELGWPKAVKRMTAEEVAHQLCNRLADRLWNRPNVD